MFKEEMEEFVNKYATPTVPDIETAKITIIRALSEASHSLTAYTETTQFVRESARRMAVKFSPIPLPLDYLSIDPDLNTVRAEATVREALQSLQSAGALIGIGPIIFGPAVNINELKQPIRLHSRYGTNAASCSVVYPSIFSAYRLAPPFAQGENFRLANGDIYLSHLNQSLLPSRAKRCLKECIEAFKHGLYLSAAMSIGAASESLWMRLGRLVCDKDPSSSKKVDDQIRRVSPSISSIINETWQVLRSQYTADLDKIFFNRGERDVFKKRADLFCERRNYAMHNEDADEDEPAFTYDETAILLLGSVNYFNRLTDIIAALDA